MDPWSAETNRTRNLDWRCISIYNAIASSFEDPFNGSPSIPFERPFTTWNRVAFLRDFTWGREREEEARRKEGKRRERKEDGVGKKRKKKGKEGRVVKRGRRRRKREEEEYTPCSYLFWDLLWWLLVFEASTKLHGRSNLDIFWSATFLSARDIDSLLSSRPPPSPYPRVYPLPLRSSVTSSRFCSTNKPMIVAAGPAFNVVARHFAVTVKNPLSPRWGRGTSLSRARSLCPLECALHTSKIEPLSMGATVNERCIEREIGLDYWRNLESIYRARCGNCSISNFCFSFSALDLYRVNFKTCAPLHVRD